MATAKKPAKKAEGEWSHEVISEWKQSKTVLWRAQKSLTPDGKTIFGIRKFVVRANGDEVVTRDGISFPPEAETLKEGVEGVISLLQDLLKTKPGKAVKKAVKAEAEDDSDGELLVLYKKSTDRYLKAIDDEGVIKVTPDKGRAKKFHSQEELENFLFEEGGDTPSLKTFKPVILK